MMENNKNIDEIEFMDIVVEIPKNTAYMTITATTYEDGEPVKVSGKFGPADIRECVQNFEATIAGEYPKFVITDEGEKWLDWRDDE